MTPNMVREMSVAKQRNECGYRALTFVVSDRKVTGGSSVKCLVTAVVRLFFSFAKFSEMARVECGGVAGCPCVAFSMECFCSKTVKMYSELVYVF
jgi:hypothetical protein